METIKMEDKDGNIKEYEVVISFYSNKNKKHYLVYTDNKKDEDNNYVYYALSYNPLDPSEFDEIKNNEEWMEIERVIKDAVRIVSSLLHLFVSIYTFYVVFKVSDKIKINYKFDKDFFDKNVVMIHLPKELLVESKSINFDRINENKFKRYNNIFLCCFN